MVATRRSLSTVPPSNATGPSDNHGARVPREIRRLHIDGKQTMRGEAPKHGNEAVYMWHGTAYAVTPDTPEEWIKQGSSRRRKKEEPKDIEEEAKHNVRSIAPDLQVTRGTKRKNTGALDDHTLGDTEELGRRAKRPRHSEPVPETQTQSVRKVSSHTGPVTRSRRKSSKVDEEDDDMPFSHSTKYMKNYHKQLRRKKKEAKRLGLKVEPLANPMFYPVAVNIVKIAGLNTKIKALRKTYKKLKGSGVFEAAVRQMKGRRAPASSEAVDPQRKNTLSRINAGQAPASTQAVEQQQTNDSSKMYAGFALASTESIEQQQMTDSTNIKARFAPASEAVEPQQTTNPSRMNARLAPASKAVEQHKDDSRKTTMACAPVTMTVEQQEDDSSKITTALAPVTMTVEQLPAESRNFQAPNAPSNGAVEQQDDYKQPSESLASLYQGVPTIEIEEDSGSDCEMEFDEARPSTDEDRLLAQLATPSETSPDTTPAPAGAEATDEDMDEAVRGAREEDVEEEGEGTSDVFTSREERYDSAASIAAKSSRSPASLPPSSQTTPPPTAEQQFPHDVFRLPAQNRAGNPLRWSIGSRTSGGRISKGTPMLTDQVNVEGRAEYAIKRGRLAGESKQARRRRVKRELEKLMEWPIVDGPQDT